MNMPSDRAHTRAKVFILFGLTAYFAYTIVSGNLNNYIDARIGWLTYVALVLFAALSVASLIELRAPIQNNMHRRVGMPSLIMMAVPLVLGTIIPSRPLGLDAITSTPNSYAASYMSANAALVNKDPLDRNVLDWARVFASEEQATVFNDQRAKVLGFVYTEPTFPENTFMVARFMVTCCVAAATSLGLPAHLPDGLADFAPGTWVEVEGTFRAQQFLDAQMPVIQVSSITPVDPPVEPYLYP